MSPEVNDPAGPEPWHYRLRIPPLDLATFRRGNAATLHPFLAARRPWRGVFVIVLACMACGGLGGWLAAWAEVGLTVILAADRPAFFWDLTGASALLLLAGLMMLALVAGAVIRSIRLGRLMRRVHAASTHLQDENTLLLGDQWLSWRNAHARSDIRWQPTATLSRAGDMHVLHTVGLSFIWLPDASFTDEAEREAVLAYIRARIAASGGAAPGPG